MRQALKATVGLVIALALWAQVAEAQTLIVNDRQVEEQVTMRGTMYVSLEALLRHLGFDWALRGGELVVREGTGRGPRIGRAELTVRRGERSAKVAGVLRRRTAYVPVRDVLPVLGYRLRSDPATDTHSVVAARPRIRMDRPADETGAAAERAREAPPERIRTERGARERSPERVRIREAPQVGEGGATSLFSSRLVGGVFAYVTHGGWIGDSNEVSVVRISDHTVVATLEVGWRPYGVAITPDGRHAYVANEGSDYVSVIRTGTNEVVATVPVGAQPTGIALTPDGSHAYVANFQAFQSGTVSVIRTSDNEVVATVPVGDRPLGVAVTPDGSRAFVANHGTNDVSVIRTSDNAVVATLPVTGTAPRHVAIMPNGSHVYVTNSGSDNVTVFRTGDLAVVATVAAGSFPFGVAVAPIGNYAYVPNFGSDDVTVVRTTDNAVVATVTLDPGSKTGLGEDPQEVAFTPDGGRAYVTRMNSNELAVIRTSDHVMVGTVPLNGQPYGVAIATVPPLEPGEAIDELNGVIDELDLPGGLTQAMRAKLDQALAALAAGDTETTCNVLKAFVNQVNAQAGKQITEADAALLIGYAEGIRELAGC